jgi:hypothetical protein
MKRVFIFFIGILAVLSFFGCAMVSTHKADLTKGPDGIRVFPQRVYLVITDEQTTFVYLPDYGQAYDVKPITIFAKNNFLIEIENGQIKKLSSDEDTPALLTFLGNLANTAAEAAAGAGVSAENITGKLGLPSGVYRMDDDGVFRRINVIQ